MAMLPLPRMSSALCACAWRLGLLLALAWGWAPARAATYDFPTAMPSGCGGGNGSYSCSISSLGYADVVTISGTKPATITFSGNLTLDAAKINQSGAASDLTIVVNGTLNPGYQSVLNANVRAGTVTDSNGQCTFGGTLRSTNGAISLAYRTSVAGAITADNDQVTLDNEVVASGNVTARKSVTTKYRTKVGGSISAGDDVVIGQETTVGGTISATGSKDISIGYAADVSGNVVAVNGSISLAQNAVARACVQAQKGGSTITLGYTVQVNGVCCGNTGSCSSSCVANNSSLAMPALCAAPATLVAAYDFNEAGYAGTAGEWKDTAGTATGPFNGKAQGSPLPGVSSADPARGGSPGSCGYASLAGPTAGGGGFVVNGLPLSTTTGAQTTVAFWMYWDGGDGQMPVGFDRHALLLSGNGIGFHTDSADLYGASSAGLANGWHHVVAVFTNGTVTSNQLWIDGSRQTLTQRTGSPNSSRAVVSGTLQIGGWGNDSNWRLRGRIDQVRVYSGQVTSAQVATLYGEKATCAVQVHHLEIRHASGTGLTCTPSTVTVAACQDTSCATPYTGGISGSLQATGGSVVWPGTAAFSIASGSSTATVSLQSITTTATVIGVASSSPAASNAATCNFGSPACTFTAADTGLLFDVPNHVSEAAQSISVSAVKKSDNSLACVPAFASVSRDIGFACSHTNPGSGTQAVRVGGTALNAGGNAAAACDGSRRTVSLAFNASGVATTTVQYADAGQMTLTATYTGSAATSDSGLTMSGSDSFIAAPDHFAVTGVTAGPIRAGSSFSATVTARNAAGNATPNFGREAPAQQAAIGWVKVQPTGSGSAAGSFTGTGARSFSGGAVTASDLAWTEVGRGDLVVRDSLAAGYLSSGLFVFGTSAGSPARHCAAEGGSCVLPGGTTAIVYYGAPGGWAMKTGQSGTVACTSANFGEPNAGVAKRCFYLASTATNGSVGDFIPHHFSVSAPNSCGSFTYAGQPATATVTAQNAAGNITLNFNGSTTTTSPSFAQAVTLGDANALGLGTLSGASIAASAFSAGVATSQVAYSFTSKATAPQSLVLRASNGSSGSSLVSSQGHTEATLALRSGRLRLSNVFGKSTAALQMPAVAEYWSGNAWLLNSADSCTALAGASVALSNPRTSTGAASTATSSAGALAISGGNGMITLAAPSPAGSSLSLDVAVNLGSTGTDQSCQAAHPATTGAGKAWLRAQNGSCAASADRDPAARASFGIDSPETRKTVHVREIF